MDIETCCLVGLTTMALLAGCSGASLQQRAEARLANAEVAMNACKERLGLGAAPTPNSMTLYDATAGPAAQDTTQVRIKTLCASELQQLLEARRTLRNLPQ